MENVPSDFSGVYFIVTRQAQHLGVILPINGTKKKIYKSLNRYRKRKTKSMLIYDKDLFTLRIKINFNLVEIMRNQFLTLVIIPSAKRHYFPLCWKLSKNIQHFLERRLSTEHGNSEGRLIIWLYIHRYIQHYMYIMHTCYLHHKLYVKLHIIFIYNAS